MEAESKPFLEAHGGERDAEGRRAVVRNDCRPEREVLPGAGPGAEDARDRTGEARSFRSELLPPYPKKAKRLEAVLPWPYLKGVSTNDFDEALKAVVGRAGEGSVTVGDAAVRYLPKPLRQVRRPGQLGLERRLHG